MTQIAVVGAAFNPPTRGHLNVVEQCLAAFDQCYLVPSYRHAFGKPMLDYSVRCELCQAFVNDIADKRVSLQAVESLIKKTGPIYSLDLMNFLADNTPANTQLHLVIGPDNAQQINQFHQSVTLTTRYPLFVAKEQIAIRSTLVRAAIKQALPLDELVTPQVAQLIIQKKLYI